MGEDGLVFAGGIDRDALEFVMGQSVEVGIARQTLNLVMPVAER
jgi:hypothetical protein